MSENRVTAIEDPDPEAARDLVADGVDRDAVVTLFGRCEVTYEGRAASYLAPGERLVVLKPDGTLLVHTDEQRTPVNWQPPGCTHAADVTDGSLVVRSTRESPEERVDVGFDRVFQASALAMSDASELEIVGSEEDLRQRILDDPDLIEPGFQPLATERPTPAGAVDVYGEDEAGDAVVLELKRRRVGPDAVGQLDRYVDALDRDLHAGTRVRGILVAPSVTDRAERLLSEKDLEFVSLVPDVETPGPDRDEADESTED